MDVFLPLDNDKECRLVHAAIDQCAFVRNNCPDEEAGLVSYLELYYCKLPHVKPIAFTIIALWLGLLFSTIGIAASDFFCVNLSTIATILGMSESMAGVTFLALGNGSPDVFSTFAAMSTNSGSLAVGELIGAAGFITAVVAGSMALVRPFRVARKSFVRDVGFFIVAASFSMVFLADGHLHLWECAAMVSFYLFYICFIFIWHWYLGRQRAKAESEQLARDSFIAADEEVPRMEGDVDHQVGRGRSASWRTTLDNFAALERGSSPFDAEADEEADDDTRDRWMAEISRNMRISRPTAGDRHNTGNPIRPSLVGALEFRAVLSSLNKSRNQQSIPIGLRRYSDDPAYTLTQQQHNISVQLSSSTGQTPEDIHHVIANDLGHLAVEGERSTRTRAVSANDAAGLSLDFDEFYRSPLPRIDLLEPTPPGSATLQIPEFSSDNLSQSGPPVSELHPQPAKIPMQSSERARQSPLELLSPANSELGTTTDPRYGSAIVNQGIMDIQRPVTDSSLLTPRPLHRRHASALLPPGTTGSSPAPFPPYYDDPTASPSRAPIVQPTSPSISPRSVFIFPDSQEMAHKRLRWWPYKLLPPPNVLTSTLCPTLHSWNDKSIGEKFLAIIAAPSVFLLAVTLPIVEIDKLDNSSDAVVVNPPSGPSIGNASPGPSNIPTIISPTGREAGIATHLSSLQDSSSSGGPQERVGGSQSSGDYFEPQGQGFTNVWFENGQHLTHSPDATSQKLNPLGLDRRSSPTEPSFSQRDWKRWLVCTQIFTAPFFVGTIVWANVDASLSLRNLLFSSLSVLIGSLLALVVILLTTSEAQPPRYRVILCFMGFIVSIAWISTIANEVVGVLKAFGVIFGISDAILGLTIFAVGNSLGDLVADVTVARLGYPVMALSACFGGPMLNILLGIGLSGLYMTIRDGNRKHARHPGLPLKYKPYQVEVDVSIGTAILPTLRKIAFTCLGQLPGEEAVENRTRITFDIELDVFDPRLYYTMCGVIVLHNGTGVWRFLSFERALRLFNVDWDQVAGELRNAGRSQVVGSVCGLGRCPD
ncbi:hypothetical protein MMC18_008790 [Xylographa bjoerkii]|nr:hypothetical protein [Xylographa bjoerkii]